MSASNKIKKGRHDEHIKCKNVPHIKSVKKLRSTQRSVVTNIGNNPSDLVRNNGHIEMDKPGEYKRIRV